MAIEYRKPNDGLNGARVVMTACPFCDADFPENSAFRYHVADCPDAPTGDAYDG